MLKLFNFILHAELVLLFRRSQEWLYPLAFFSIMISLFPLSFTPDPLFLEKYLPGCIWLAALLANLLSLQNIFLTDLEDGMLVQFLLSDVPLVIIIFAKLAAIWIATALPLILLTPLLGWLFHLSLTTIFTLTFSLLLGTPMIILIGTLSHALTIGLRQQGVLLGLLMLPLITPVLIFGVMMTQHQQAGLSIQGPGAFLAGLLILSICLIPMLIAATLRISLED